MKLLHTADWHAGRTLKGQDRTPELREALGEIAELAREQAVDLVLVPGDVYDKKTPSAEAEAAVYDFFLALSEAGIPSVVIAGNHDAPGRLDAVSGMFDLAGTRVLGEAKVAGQGGAFELHVGGETAQIAALPFVSERRIVRYGDLLGSDPGAWSEKYQAGMRRLITNLCEPFRDDSVNLLLLHTAMEGATLANSEYTFHCTSSYTLSADTLPEQVNYVALGHIHKPQSVSGFPDNAARYSGSLLQLDFGEAGDAKYAYVVEARAGRPTELLVAHEVQAGKKLKHLKIDASTAAGLDELDRKLLEVQDFPGWLKLSLRVDRPRPGLKDRIKTQLPQVLSVEFLYPEREQTRETVDVDKLDLTSAYRDFYAAQRGSELKDDLRDAFRALLEEQSDADTGQAA